MYRDTERFDLVRVLLMSVDSLNTERAKKVAEMIDLLIQTRIAEAVEEMANRSEEILKKVSQS